WRRGRWRAASARRCWRPPTRRGWTRTISCAWASRIASSSTPSAASCWRTWGWTSPGSARRRRSAGDRGSTSLGGLGLVPLPSAAVPATMAAGHQPGTILMRRVIVLGNGKREGVTAAVEHLAPFLARHSQVVLTDLFQEKDLCDIEADLVLVFGGDGAILR